MAEVEAALVYQLQTYVLGDDVLSQVLGQVREELRAQIPQRKADIKALEAELANVRTEQKRLAKAVALADDVPEPVAELHQHSARSQNLEAQLIAAKRTPAELAALVDKIEANVRANFASLRTALADQADLREVFKAMFPDGLTFEPARTPDGARQIWKITGEASFEHAAGPAGSTGPVSNASRPQRGVMQSEPGAAHLREVPGPTAPRDDCRAS